MAKVLVIDDDREMGRLLRTLFELEGHQVTVASRYQDVLPTARQFHPDVVLMDVLLQGKETVELMHQMRQEKGLSHIPVVMTSGMDKRRECLEAGATEFVLKPFLPGEMVEIVKELLD